MRCFFVAAYALHTTLTVPSSVYTGKGLYYELGFLKERATKKGLFLTE